MTVQTVPFALQGASHGAELFRRAVNSLLPSGSHTRLGVLGRGGVVQSGDFAITQHGTPNMSVDVASGEAWVPGSTGLGADIGAYYGLNDATVNQPIAGSDPTNPRIDTVVLQVEDAQYTGAANDIKLAVVTGTPTSGATLVNLNGKGALPNNALLLYYVLVPAGASSIVTADLSDQRAALTAPTARMYQNSQTVVGSGANVQVVNLIADYSAGGMTFGTSSIIVPYAGIYDVSWSIGWQFGGGGVAAAGLYGSQVWKNGSVCRQATSYAPVGTNPVVGDSDNVRLAAGDVLTLIGSHNSGTNEGTFARIDLTWLSATMVEPHT